MYTAIAQIVCCFVLFDIAETSVTHVWPLYYGDPELEITTFTSEGESGCSVSEAVTHPGLTYGGISLSGDKKSYVDIDVTSGTAVGDFAISLTVYPLSNTGGTLFHYHHDPSGDNPLDGNITDIILAFNSTTIFLDVYGVNNENLGSLAIEHTILAETWDLFSLVYDISKPEMKVISEISKDLDKVTLSTKNAKIGFPGVIRIGAPIGDQPYQGFHGYSVCLVMHDAKFGHAELKNIISECSTDKWNINQTSLTEEVSGCGKTFQRGYYVIVAQGKDVDEETTPLSEISNLSSRFRCASRCLLDETCFSFSYNMLQGMCKLFDGDYADELVDDSSTTYYLQRT